MRISLSSAVGLHEREQAFAFDRDHFARCARAYADEPTTAREHVDFAGELARSTDGHNFLGPPRWPDHLNVTCSHDEEARVLTCFDKHFATLDLARFSVRRNARDLSGCQCWKQPVQTCSQRWRN